MIQRITFILHLTAICQQFLAARNHELSIFLGGTELLQLLLDLVCFLFLLVNESSHSVSNMKGAQKGDDDIGKFYVRFRTIKQRGGHISNERSIPYFLQKAGGEKRGNIKQTPHIQFVNNCSALNIYSIALEIFGLW